MLNITTLKLTRWIPKPPILPWILFLMALTLGGVAKQCSVPKIPTSIPSVALASKPVVNVAKVEVALESPKKTLKVYPQSIKRKLKIPTEAIHNANIVLTDSSVIQGTERDTQVNQVLDVSTGETTTYVTPLPSPWFRLENRGAASLDYGFKRNATEPVARLNVRQDVLQIKQLHLGVSGSVYSDGDYFVGIGGEYRW